MSRAATAVRAERTEYSIVKAGSSGISQNCPMKPKFVEPSGTAFGRSARDDGSQAPALDARRAAEDALTRASGVLAFVGDSSEPLAGELGALYAAVAPLFGR